MLSLHAVVEGLLSEASWSFRKLKFWKSLGILAIAVCAGVLLLGALLWRGWLTSFWIAAVSYLGLLAVGVVGFLVIAAVTLSKNRPRPELAQTVERVHRPLLDRLNALVDLEPRRRDPRVAPYFRRIEEQARSEILTTDSVPLYPRRNVQLLWLLFAVLLWGTVSFYQRYDPWKSLNAFQTQPAEDALESPEDGPLPEGPKDSTVELAEAPWGEVRITEPGRDLEVTKVDVVPLVIEAASNQPLKGAAWFTAVGGEDPAEHGLPAPSEKHYAVYKPTLYVDEMRLSDWDVVAYHASASTRGGSSYASEVYFLEVRPFKEDIRKLPGGEGGKAFQSLNELTGLINRQKHVIRETHRFLARSYDKPEMRRQDQEKLAQAEGELQEATRHAYARIASEMEHASVGDILDNLAQAETELGKATEALRQDPPAARSPEQQALAHLVTTRKSLQKAISDNPNAFGQDGNGEELPPVADLPGKLKQITELRDEEKAARELLEKLEAEQRSLAQRAKPGTANPDLAARQKELRSQLNEFREAHPRPFEGAQKESRNADSAMNKARESLEKGEGSAPEDLRQAAEALDKLAGKLGRDAQSQDLARAYQLKEMLDRQAGQLDKMQKSPGSFSDEQTGQTAEGAKGAAKELGEIANQPGAENLFGPPLKDALSSEKQKDLASKMDALKRAETPEERQQAAAAGEQALENVTEAFEKSAPAIVQDLRGKDSLGGRGEDALDRALRQIASLLPGGTGGDGRILKREDRERLQQEALENLRRGLEDRKGKDRRVDALLLDAEKELKKVDLAVDGPRLKRLLEQIEQLRVQMADVALEKPKDPSMTHIDPSRLPATYRERIQRYYRKLSEK